jgi:hypothetical protein
MAMLTNTKFVERRYHFRSVMMKGEDAAAYSSARVFLAIRSMSAIGMMCHSSLAPPAATRFPSSIIIAAIVGLHRWQFRRGPLMRNTCSN